MPKSKEETWYEWRSLVNMSAPELRRFLNTEEGRQAGLSRSQAKKEGVRSGQASARALLKMIPSGGRSYTQAEKNWSDADWDWARRQVAFIKRMCGVKGPLSDGSGELTRKHTALLLWGHDPTKR